MRLALRVEVRDDQAEAICERLRPRRVGRRPSIRELLTARLRDACERELVALLAPGAVPGELADDEMAARLTGKGGRE